MMNNTIGKAQFRRIAIGVLIERRGEGVRILISRRPDGAPLAGYWEFPGGKCEPGEAVEACLRREFREEMGIEVEPVEALEPIEHRYGHASVRLYPFLCRRADDSEPRPLGVAEWRWVRPDELADYTFPPANATLLPQVAAAAEQRRQEAAHGRE